LDTAEVRVEVTAPCGSGKVSSPAAVDHFACGDSFALLQLQADKTFSVLHGNALVSSGSPTAVPVTNSSHEVIEKKPPHISIIMVGTATSAVVLGLLYWAGMRMVNRSKEADPSTWYHMSAERAAATAEGLDVASCFAGIIIFFCSYGVAQEFIMTEEYDGDKFPSVPFIIMVNRVMLVIVASTTMIASKESINFRIAKWTAIPSATVLISSWAQYTSLDYVTFPTQVVFKSAKIVPTMLVNTVINRVWQQWGDYILALIITGCVIGFSLIAEKAEAGVATSDTLWGIFLLCLFLLCDALTSNTEKWVYNMDKEFTNTQMMFAMGIVTLVYSTLASALSSGGFPVVFAFLQKHPECILQVVMLALCSTFGQWVIYYTVRKHGPVLLAVMMTVRQIISIYVSAVLYVHYIPPIAALCAAGAFGACLWKPFYRYMARASDKGEEGTKA